MCPHCWAIAAIVTIVSIACANAVHSVEKLHNVFPLQMSMQDGMRRARSDFVNNEELARLLALLDPILRSPGSTMANGSFASTMMNGSNFYESIGYSWLAADRPHSSHPMSYQSFVSSPAPHSMSQPYATTRRRSLGDASFVTPRPCTTPQPCATTTWRNPVEEWTDSWVRNLSRPVRYAGRGTVSSRYADQATVVTRVLSALLLGAASTSKLAGRVRSRVSSGRSLLPKASSRALSLAREPEPARASWRALGAGVLLSTASVFAGRSAGRYLYKRLATTKRVRNEADVLVPAEANAAGDSSPPNPPFGQNSTLTISIVCVSVVIVVVAVTSVIVAVRCRSLRRIRMARKYAEQAQQMAVDIFERRPTDTGQDPSPANPHRMESNRPAPLEFIGDVHMQPVALFDTTGGQSVTTAVDRRTAPPANRNLGYDPVLFPGYGDATQ
ncbi:unnamed protein product (mitochondrion) [Plasmodiophora brassicae]|uniref:Transmembrane protein n=1 Tax=Plasmodiophora brassicae TaxID=37360 RepID=A0A3P3Y6I8_PLABS|nr:unnamed protein product [Plasmodiophora brassicae]